MIVQHMEMNKEKENSKKGSVARATAFLPVMPHAQNLGLGFRGGFRGGVMPCCKNIIADYVPHIPWIEDLLGTFLGFCPVVYQNPTLFLVSVPDES